MFFMKSKKQNLSLNHQSFFLIFFLIKENVNLDYYTYYPRFTVNIKAK